MESIIEVLDYFREEFPLHVTGHPNKYWLHNGIPLSHTNYTMDFIEDEYGLRIFYFLVTSKCGLRGIAVIAQNEL